MNARGWTLLEKILVLVLIAVLLSAVIPIYRYYRDRAAEARARANLAALAAWYNSEVALGRKLTQTDVLLFLQRDPRGKKIRCPSGRLPVVVLGFTDLETPEYRLRFNPSLLAVCRCQVHPSARNRVDFSRNPPIYHGTGNEKWTDKIFLCVFKDGRVDYASEYQIEWKSGIQ
jgi:type II secretory pathway pseudopilin PulG